MVPRSRQPGTRPRPVRRDEERRRGHDADTVAAFDWNLNEECFFYDECHIVDQFIRAGKAVFTTEYIAGDWEQRGYTDPMTLATSPEFCPSARQRSFATLVKYEVPDASFVTC